MYFHKGYSGSKFQETGNFHAMLVRREYYPIMHKMNLEWVRDVIGELEHDLPIHLEKEIKGAESAESKVECNCTCYCGKKVLPPALQCPLTVDGRPHRWETCKLEIGALRSLEAELMAETARIEKTSAQKSELLKDWTANGVVPSVFT